MSENGQSVQEPLKKKGNASWKPRETAKVKLDPNFRYRWVDTSEGRIATLLEQGWEICSALNGERRYKGKNEESVIDGKPLNTVVGDRDRILMRLPIDGAKIRDKFYEEKAIKQVKAVRAKASQETGVNATGSLKITGVTNEIID